MPNPIETMTKNPAALYNAKISQLDLIQFISSKFHSQEEKKKLLCVKHNKKIKFNGVICIFLSVIYDSYLHLGIQYIDESYRETASA